LVYLFGCKSEYTQQFDHYFDHRFGHRRSGWDFRINLESSQEVFDAFEDVDKGIVTLLYILGGLPDEDTVIGWKETTRVTRTERRMPIPEKISFAGGNA
jgi:hypothetical protein